jgi:NAD(P)-dependent dehydrogenase (short-subunit alcohol dehydrogenase family)
MAGPRGGDGMNGLQGRVALVTGSAQGIGEATARTFAANGAKVVISDVQREKGEAVAADLRSQGVDAHFAYADVMDYDSVSQMVAEASSVLGPIDILVNNAGGAPPGCKFGELRAMTVADIDGFLKLNLTSAFYCSKAVIDGMVERRFGKIVCVNSIATPLGQYGGTGYASAKAGLDGFVRSLAKELGGYGINVNAVMYGNAPHWTRTEERQKALDEWTPMHRVGTLQEFANATVFLASEEASYITAETLVCDGGITRFAMM